MKLAIDVGSSAVKLLVQREDGEVARFLIVSGSLDRAVLTEALPGEPVTAAVVTSGFARDNPRVAAVLDLLASEQGAVPAAFISKEQALAGFAAAAGRQLGASAGVVADLGAAQAVIGRLHDAQGAEWTQVANGLDQPTEGGETVGRAAALLGYLRAGDALRPSPGVRQPGLADLLTWAFASWLGYQTQVGEPTGVETVDPVIWAGGGGALAGASISQSMGHAWYVFSTLPRAELALGALNAEPPATPVPASGGVAPMPVSRVAWPDIGFVQVPEQRVDQIASGQVIEGPVRVVCPSGEIVIPPETVVTRVGGFLVCGVQKWG